MILYVLLLISVVGATTPNLVSPPAECFTNYTCFVPMKCIDAATTDTDNDIIKLRKSHKVDDKCSLFLMIHPFAHNWYRISMESFVDTKKIELRHSVPNPADTTSNVVETLTCSTDDTIAKAQRAIGTAAPTDINMKEGNVKPLKCVFEINGRSAREKISEQSFDMKEAHAIVHETGATTLTKSATLSADIYCIPGVFPKPRENFKPDKTYAQVLYTWDDKDEKKWNSVRCENPLVYNTIEYSPDGKNFKKVEKLVCDKGYQLKIDGTTNPLKEDFDVRCVADAHYGCNYEPNYVDNGKSNEKKLEMIKADVKSDNPVKAKLGCPTGYPYFVMKGLKKPLRDAQFVCKNYYGNMKWTFNGTKILSKTENPVHCVKEVECHVMNPIPRARLQESFLRQNAELAMVPTCQSKGILKAKEGNNGKEEVVSEVTCDRSTGTYQYRVNATGEIKDGTDETIYSCKFPDIVIDNSDAKNAANTSKLRNIALGAAGGVLLVSVVAVVSAISIANHRIKKANQRLLKADALDSERFNPGAAVNIDTKSNNPKEKSDDVLANDYLTRRRQDALITIKRGPNLEEMTKESDKDVVPVRMKENEEFRNTGVRKLEKFKFVKTETMPGMENLLKKKSKLSEWRRDPPGAEEPQQQNPADMEMKTQSEEKPEDKKTK